MIDHDSQLGFHAVPERYAGGGRETIDKLRDLLGDYGLELYCLGQMIRYNDRMGIKGPRSVDLSKQLFYRQLRQHLRGVGPDPRHQRPGFVAYQRPDGSRNCAPVLYSPPAQWFWSGILIGLGVGGALGFWFAAVVLP